MAATLGASSTWDGRGQFIGTTVTVTNTSEICSSGKKSIHLNCNISTLCEIGIQELVLKYTIFIFLDFGSYVYDEDSYYDYYDGGGNTSCAAVYILSLIILNSFALPNEFSELLGMKSLHKP